MYGQIGIKKGRIPNKKRQFPQKSQKSRAFRLTHLNIFRQNRPSRAENGDPKPKTPRFRGPRENPFSQSV